MGSGKWVERRKSTAKGTQSSAITLCLMFHNMLWFWPSELRGTGLGFGLGMRSTSDTANVANVAAATAGLSQLLRHYKRCQRHHNQLFARLNLFFYVPRTCWHLGKVANFPLSIICCQIRIYFGNAFDLPIFSRLLQGVLV